MTAATHNKLVSFIWSIADDCLRDVYVRGKYRDVILPMVVLRRLDVLLEETKSEVMEDVRFQLEEMGLTELDETALQAASKYVFYNTSKWTLQRLKDTASNSQQLLQVNFQEYLNGFSTNVKEIVDKFKLQPQIKHMADKVIKKTQKFKEEKLNELLQYLGCTKQQLPDFDYFPRTDAIYGVSKTIPGVSKTMPGVSKIMPGVSNTNEYITYETESELRDYENVPLKENIYDYFLQEVKPHVPEAWIDLEKTKIGYEVSFNKYFYKHKPLRSIEEVSAEIVELEKENEGLIADILNLD